MRDLREFRRWRELLAASQVASATPFARHEINSLSLHGAEDFDGHSVQRPSSDVGKCPASAVSVCYFPELSGPVPLRLSLYNAVRVSAGSLSPEAWSLYYWRRGRCVPPSAAGFHNDWQPNTTQASWLSASSEAGCPLLRRKRPNLPKIKDTPMSAPISIRVAQHQIEGPAASFSSSFERPLDPQSI